MKFNIITLFPDMFTALEHGIVGRAQQKGLINLAFFNPRDYAPKPYQQVDDRPFGGGPGMVMQVAPLRQSIAAAKAESAKGTDVHYLAPEGKPLTHAAIEDLSQQSELIVLAGRYEGIDQRLIDRDVDHIWSIGDFVVSGGELPIMLMIDAITRLLPDALGHPQSAQQDSFSQGLLDYPHYTRPAEIDGQKVPTVLLSGDHQAIARWRMKMSLKRTKECRPDLLIGRDSSKLERQILDEIIHESDSE